MKFTQKTALCLMSLCAVVGQSHAAAAHPSVKETIFHLFQPIDQHHSQKNLDELCHAVEARIAQGQEYTAAFNDEVQKFLLAQLTAAYLEIAKQQKINGYTQEDAQAAATFVMTEILVKQYALKCHANLFEQNPMSLPPHLFAFFTTHYFAKAHGQIALPQANRFDVASMMHYAYLVRVGIAYGSIGFAYANKALDALGVPQAQI